MILVTTVFLDSSQKSSQPTSSEYFPEESTLIKRDYQAGSSGG